MASSAVKLPYICPRCAKLFRPQHLTARRSFLFSRTQRTNHSDASPHDDEPTKRRAFRSQFAQSEPPARAATLQSTSLGASTSILILDDSGRKRGKRSDLSGLEEIVPNEHNAVRISEIIEKTARLPGQEEVNQSIESVRPDDLPTYGDRLYVSRKRFDQIASALMQQFNMGQLSRYVTIKQGARLVGLQKQTSSSSVRQSRWHANGSGSRHALRPLKVSKLTGKRAVVDALLRTVWQLDVEDETTADGLLEMSPRECMLRLLTLEQRGRTSKLSKISQRHQVRVEVSSGIIEIHGHEPACMKASHDINMVVSDAAELPFDLKAFQDDSCTHTLSDTQTLDEVASRHGAVLQHTAQSKEVIIIAESLSQAHRCKKMLLGYVLEANAPQAVIVYNHNSGDGPVNTIEAVAPSSGKNGTWLSRIAMNLARGDTPVLLKPNYPVLSDETVSAVMSNFRSEHRFRPSNGRASSSSNFDDIASTRPDWAIDSKTMFNVEMGQISFDGIGRFNKPLRPRFESLVPGLSQFFMAKFQDCVPNSQTCLKVDWVASPWDNSDLPSRLLARIPRLRMTLLPNASIQGFDMESLVAVEATPRKVYLPIPTTGTDLKIIQSEEIDMLHPLRDPNLSSLLDSFNKEAQINGLEKAQLPETIRFQFPNFLLPSEVIDRSGEGTQFDYRELVLTALPSLLTQKISVPYEGLSLEYQSVYGGESTSSYNLSLQMSVESLASSDEVFAAQRGLLASADKLSCELSGALGPFKIPPAVTREIEGRSRSLRNGL